MKKKIKNQAKKYGIEYCGFTKIDGKTAIVFLFPYFYKYYENSNISIYTYGKDYHLVIKQYLNNICDYIITEIANFSYEIYTDISPYNDINLAYLSGLGFIGKNNLLINEKYGSYVFIGYIITDTEFEPDSPLSATCINCNKCIVSCPSGALKSKDFSICLSAVTQKKGNLSVEEQKYLKNNKYAFGCDICQKVCPMNKGEITPIREFKENLTIQINKQDFENLSNKQFKKKYGHKAFSWRGPKVLIRNLSLLEDESENQQE